MTEVLVRTVRKGAGSGATPGAVAGEGIFSDSYLDVRVAGGLKDRDVHIGDRDLCLVLGHVAGGRSAGSIREEYRRSGAAGVAALDGHFLVVFYDRSNGEVSIIHDKGGFRHAYYWSQDENFALSTELSWLMDASLSERQTRISRQGLALYVTFEHLPSPYTMFEDTFQLPPGGELLGRRGNQARVRRHDAFAARRSVELAGGSEEHSARIAQILTESMAERLDDGPQPGAMLSGGTDTSTNVALLVEHLDRRPITFTASFREEGYDETPYAKLVADHYNLDNITMRIKPTMLEELPKIIDLFDSPHADQSIFAEYFLCRKARELGCRQLVTGEGGDEVLGYPRAHYEDLDFSALPRDDGELARLYLEQTFLAPRKIRNELLTNLGLAPDGPYGYLEGVYRGYHEWSPFERLHLGQWRTWLIDGVYMKDSRVPRHFDLDPVLPFMSTQLMTYVAELPTDEKMSGLEDKRFLETILVDKVPAQILDRGKHKFWVPFSEWFRTGAREYLRDNLLTSNGFVAEHLGRDTIRRLVDEHEAGTDDHNRLLWAFLFLELWFQSRARHWLSPGRSHVG